MSDFNMDARPPGGCLGVLIFAVLFFGAMAGIAYLAMFGGCTGWAALIVGFWIFVEALWRKN